jgi:hypothetical protein
MAASDRMLFFEPRFCGPPGTVNGGVACGAIAALCGRTTEVTLHRPIPPDRPLTVEYAGDSALTVLDGGTPLAAARPAADAADSTVPSVSAELAEAVAGRARYFTDPDFPDCFVCGRDRAPGHGLRIFPGPVPGRSVWAAPWTPDASVAASDGRVRPEIVWAALDCPTGIAAGEAAQLPADTTVLLGRMTARITTRPRAGQACRVVAWPVARSGRRLSAGSALLDPAGAVLATGRTGWITVPRPAHRQPVGATP